MTSLDFISPSQGSIVKGNTFGEVVVRVTKPIYLIIYTVTFTIYGPNSVVVWSAQADNSGSESRADLNWPEEPGDYAVEAVVVNGIGSELARTRTNFTITKG